MSYQDLICYQIKEFKTPPNCTDMSAVELVEYHAKMETLGCKVNVYGPERCALFRTYCEVARSEIINRYQAWNPKQSGWKTTPVYWGHTIVPWNKIETSLNLRARPCIQPTPNIYWNIWNRFTVHIRNHKVFWLCIFVARIFKLPTISPSPHKLYLPRVPRNFWALTVAAKYFLYRPTNDLHCPNSDRNRLIVRASVRACTLALNSTVIYGSVIYNLHNFNSP